MPRSSKWSLFFRFSKQKYCMQSVWNDGNNEDILHNLRNASKDVDELWLTDYLKYITGPSYLFWNKVTEYRAHLQSFKTKIIEWFMFPLSILWMFSVLLS
jgi:hypothetical protein